MPPPTPQRSGRATAIVISVLVLLLVVGSTAAYITVDQTDMLATPTGDIEPGTADDGPPPRPDDDADRLEVIDFVEGTIEHDLGNRSEALLDNDREGWMRAVDSPADEQMELLFDNLQTMGVSRYDFDVSRPREGSSDDEYEIRVTVTQCFSTPVEDCWPIDGDYHTTWQDLGEDEGFELTGFEADDSEWTRPFPWEIEPLTALAGRNTLAVAPSHMEGELDNYLSMSEGAASVSDPWEVWEEPDQYLVFFADKNAFDEWFGGIDDNDGGVLGYATVLEGTIEGTQKNSASITVMGVDNHRDNGQLRSTVRHELAHAATRWAAPEVRAKPEAWWFIEGIAEYIDQGETDVRSYLRSYGMKDFVDDGLCDNGIVPSDSDDGEEISAKYGCAYLGVRYLLDNFDREQFEEVFAAVGREGKTVKIQVESILDVDYDDLMSDIGDYIREMI